MLLVMLKWAKGTVHYLFDLCGIKKAQRPIEPFPQQILHTKKQRKSNYHCIFDYLDQLLLRSDNNYNIVQCKIMKLIQWIVSSAEHKINK